MKVYAIDLDGVLDIPANVVKVNKLFNNPDNVIIIHTSRCSLIRKETEEFLQKQGVMYHALVMDKLRADYYIDDKNINL